MIRTNREVYQIFFADFILYCSPGLRGMLVSLCLCLRFCPYTGVLVGASVPVLVLSFLCPCARVFMPVPFHLCMYACMYACISICVCVCVSACVCLLRLTFFLVCLLALAFLPSVLVAASHCFCLHVACCCSFSFFALSLCFRFRCTPVVAAGIASCVLVACMSSLFCLLSVSVQLCVPVCAFVCSCVSCLALAACLLLWLFLCKRDPRLEIHHVFWPQACSLVS